MLILGTVGQTMAEYIKREVAYELARTNGYYSDFHKSMADLTSLKELLDDTPTADVVEVKHGEWLPVFHNDKFKGGKCSECGKYKKSHNITFLNKNYKFCHSCGAKMDK